MGHMVGGILVLLLGLSVAAGQETPARPAAPAEQYAALVKEFGEAAHANWKATTDEERKQAAARVEPLPLRLLELAEKNPKEPWTLDALTQVITQEHWLDNYSSHPGWGKDSRQARAIAIVLRDHVAATSSARLASGSSLAFAKNAKRSCARCSRKTRTGMSGARPAWAWPCS